MRAGTNLTTIGGGAVIDGVDDGPEGPAAAARNAPRTQYWRPTHSCQVAGLVGAGYWLRVRVSKFPWLERIAIGVRKRLDD